jgi:hypothetical protein
VTFAKNKENIQQIWNPSRKRCRSRTMGKISVDMVGPYTTKRRGAEALTLWSVTMIDPATGWFEIKL